MLELSARNPAPDVSRKKLLALLQCPLCAAALNVSEAQASCGRHTFPVEGGIPRLLPPDLMEARDGHDSSDLRARTYRSFGFEWRSFSTQVPAYRDNFEWYTEPLRGIPLRNSLVLDAGCGMGRHTHHFLREGASVVALDASAAIDVAARNNDGSAALFLQADILHLPLKAESFDVACCLGVLHHIEDTEEGLRSLVRVTRPGGWVLVYLYHDPSEFGSWRGALLRLVSAARRITTRLPLGVLRALTWLLSVALFVAYIGPVKILSRISRRRFMLSLPLGLYVEYPFVVLWNDQFDRFSAPIEKRYRRAEATALMRGAGLTDVRILGGHGWRAAGRRPERT
jgi:SAM-dependent methyltransferase